jgi:hypothetical protein
MAVSDDRRQQRPPRPMRVVQIGAALAVSLHVRASIVTSPFSCARPGWEDGMYSFTRRVVATDRGHELCIKRRHSIEPVFGRIKHTRGITRFRRRGRAAARSEWRLITATHSLPKLHGHRIANTA